MKRVLTALALALVTTTYASAQVPNVITITMDSASWVQKPDGTYTLSASGNYACPPNTYATDPNAPRASTATAYYATSWSVTCFKNGDLISSKFVPTNVPSSGPCYSDNTQSVTVGPLDTTTIRVLVTGHKIVTTTDARGNVTVGQPDPIGGDTTFNGPSGF